MFIDWALVMCMEGFTVLVADDHPILRLGIGQLLSNNGEFSLIGQAQNGKEAIAMIDELQPDVALLDMVMPEVSGISVIKHVYDAQLATKTVLMTAFLDQEVYEEVMGLHVAGILLKTNALDEVVDCLKAVTRGQQFVSPDYALQLESIKKPKTEHKKNLQVLSLTERQILTLIAQNLSTQEIAQKTERSPETIKKHRSHICKKLDLTGKNALLTFALQNRHLLVEG